MELSSANRRPLSYAQQSKTGAQIVTSRFPLTVWALRHPHKDTLIGAMILPMIAVGAMISRWILRDSGNGLADTISSLNIAICASACIAWLLPITFLIKSAHWDKDRWQVLLLSGPSPLDYTLSLSVRVVSSAVIDSLAIWPLLVLRQTFLGESYSVLVLTPFLLVSISITAFATGLFGSTIFPAYPRLGLIAAGVLPMFLILADAFMMLNSSGPGVILNIAVTFLREPGARSLPSLEFWLIKGCVPIAVALLSLAYLFVHRLVRSTHVVRQLRFAPFRIRTPRFIAAGPVGKLFVSDITLGFVLFFFLYVEPVLGALGFAGAALWPAYGGFICYAFVVICVAGTLMSWGRSPTAPLVVLTESQDGALFRAAMRVLYVGTVLFIPALFVCRVRMFELFFQTFSIFDFNVPLIVLFVALLDAFVTYRMFVFLSCSATLTEHLSDATVKHVLRRFTIPYIVPCFLFLELPVQAAGALRLVIPQSQLLIAYITFTLLRTGIYYQLGTEAKETCMRHLWRPMRPLQQPHKGTAYVRAQ
jgi:hypothetical protein